MTDPTMIIVLATLVGACVGSFLNVCVARWPHDMSVVSPPSRCPKCERPIRWFENVPVLGWLSLAGKCRGCRAPISPIYPIVELVVTLGWLAAFVSFGPGLTALRVAVLGTVLLGVAITDAKHYLIPDGFTVFGLGWMLATAAAGAVLGDQGPFAGLYDALIGACVGAGVIAIIGWLGEVFLKKEAMGFGDVTLMAVVGAAVGPSRALLVVFLGAFLGAVSFVAVLYPLSRLRGAQQVVTVEPTPDGGAGDAGGESVHVPFGVFLAPAAIVALLWGHDLVDWYLARLTG